jgi:hypothetical protein
MSRKLQESPLIHSLARELGISLSDNVVADILNFCDYRINKLMEGFSGCDNPAEILEWVAARLETEFKVAYTNKELLDIRQHYVDLGEKVFATLVEDLSENDFGITIRRTNRQSWERLYVSVIDCRGEKGVRGYFTKWHEVAHLLTITDQKRSVFRRTHASVNYKNPEESLMDVIAGRFGFRPSSGLDLAANEISFETIEDLRKRLCPEASKQSALINFVKFWPTPCLLICAQMGHRKREKAQAQQQRFDFAEEPAPALRAVHVTASESAREIGFTIFENMRVPEASVIHRVFNEESIYDQAEEDLSWWNGK